MKYKVNQLRDTTRSDLQVFFINQQDLAKGYLIEENREMAYLAIWSILEKFAKTVAKEYRRQELIKSLKEWSAYLADEKSKPKKPNTVLDSYQLPEEKLFIRCLNYYGYEGEKLWSIMHSKGKYRDWRNDLAHKAVKFKNINNFKTLYNDLEQSIPNL